MVLDTHKRGRYPRAALTGATMYHYGWVRSEAQMNLKLQTVDKYWLNQPRPPVHYAAVDPATLRWFTGTHPASPPTSSRQRERNGASTMNSAAAAR